MMQRLAFARLAARKKWNHLFISSSSSSSPIPIIIIIIPKKLTSFSSISNSNLQLLLQSSFSSLSNNPRSFSQTSSINDGEENGVVHAEDFENVVSLLLQTQSNADDDGLMESCLNSLQHFKTTPNQHFVLKLIETPNVSGHNLIRFIKWARNKKSFKVTTPVLESLVSAICPEFYKKEKEIDSLWDLIKDIGLNEGGVLNVQILNQLIESFGDLGKGKAALDVFKKFELFQCVPNPDTYYFTIKALCRESNGSDHAWSVCQKMLDLDSLPDDTDKISQIVCWFCLCRMAKQAHAVYLAAREKRKQLPSWFVNLMVTRLCVENETVQQASEMLLNDIPIPEEGRNQVIQPLTCTSVISALCRIKEVDTAKQLILKMIADGPPPGIADFKYVITGYTEAGKMEQAMEMVKLMESRGFKPDLSTCVDLMSGYSNGMKSAAKEVSEKLKPILEDRIMAKYPETKKRLSLESQKENLGGN